MTDGRHDMTADEMRDALEMLEAGRLLALVTSAQTSSTQADSALQSVRDVKADIGRAKAAASRQTVWRWVAAVGSLIAAAGFIWLSTSLDDGVGQLSAELIGGALLTYVLVERGVSALASIPARDVKQLDDRVAEAITRAEYAVQLSRDVVHHVEGLANLGK